MSLFSTLLAAGSFAAVISAQTVVGNTTFSATASASTQARGQTANATTSASIAAAYSGNDAYRVYAGRATPATWPTNAQWVSDFETMFNQNLPNIKIGCAQFRVPNNMDAEITILRGAIQQVSSENGVDPRFILAVVMQESTGCVRAPSTFGVHNNPGLMQSNRGAGTCNQGGVVQTPCPQNMILTMIRDGATGTAYGDGLARLLPQTPSQDDMKYYQAARMYNSGSIDSSGYLERGVATHCYASDVANRLTGWVQAPSTCRFDIDGLPPLSSTAPVFGATGSASPMSSVRPSRVGLSPLPAGPSSIRAGLSPLPAGTASFGATLRTSVIPSSSAGLVFGAVQSRQALMPITASPSANIARSTGLPTASRSVASNPGPGVTTNCAEYHRVVFGDSCSRVVASAGLTLVQFRALNTGINSDCTNLWVGYDYCIRAS